MGRSAKAETKIQLPPTHNWRTSDADEVNRRRQRAREESFVISNTTPEHPIFSNFRVKSASGQTIEHRMLETLAMKQSVATSVLDRPGEVKEIKLRSGRQAFVERLQQLVTPAHKIFGAKPAGTVSPTPPSRELLTDPALAFARIASERLPGMILRCEEQYPLSGTHTVLTVVVERGVAEQVEKLKSLHSELFGLGKTDPLAPVQLEVMDRATDEAIQRLIAAGIISKTARASRPLLTCEENPASAPLSPEESAKAKCHRDQASRKLKMARLLGEGGFDDETRPVLREAVHALGRALAVERRLPEPLEVKDALQPPLSHAFGEGLPKFRAFLETPGANWKPVAECLSHLSDSA